MSGTGGAMLQVAGYGLGTAVCLVLGAALAVFSTPTKTARSGIQHVAAGLVFAAVGVEVLPDVIHRNLPLAAAAGFALGVATMLAIEALSTGLEGSGSGDTANWSFIAVLVVDLVVDGVLIGVTAGAAGDYSRQAALIAVALAAELLALGLSVGATLREAAIPRRRIMVVACGVSLAPVVGAVMGYLVAGALTGAWVEAVLAFGVAALLYLATEELLKEAHEVPETPVSTALFFTGFLAVLIIDMLAVAASS